MIPNKKKTCQPVDKKSDKITFMRAGIDYIGVITPFFCTDGNGKFLFYKRGRSSKDEQGKWDCSGGTLQFGEQPVEGMRRKLRSQYQVEGKVLDQLPPCSIVLDINGIQNHWLAVPFIVQVDSDQVKIGEPEKMDEIEWFSLSRLPEPIHPGAKYILDLHQDVFNKYG